MRLLQIADGAETEDNAGFPAAPVADVLHLVTVTFFSPPGARQFAPHLSTLSPMGRAWLCPTGLVAALSGLWMVQF